jgi:hypothetical protein
MASLTKKMTAVVHPAQLKAFMARCRTQRVYAQGVIRTLAAFYADGRIAPEVDAMRAPARPYKAWVIFKADAGALDRLRARASRDGRPMAAVVRGLMDLFVSDELPPAVHRLILKSAAFEPGGRGGRGWRGRAPIEVRRLRRRASIKRRARARAS